MISRSIAERILSAVLKLPKIVFDCCLPMCAIFISFSSGLPASFVVCVCAAKEAGSMKILEELWYGNIDPNYSRQIRMTVPRLTGGNRDNRPHDWPSL